MNVFLSVVDGTNPPVSNLKIAAPINSTLFQVMILGEKQHPKTFSFKYVLDSKWGHMVTCINGKCQKAPFYWMVYHDGQLTPKGVDGTCPKNDDSYTWKYEEPGKKINVANEAEQISVNPDNKELITVKISAESPGKPSWSPVSNLPVLVESGSTLRKIMEKAQEQHPKKVRHTTDVESVKSINELENSGTSKWLVYAHETKEPLITGLDDTIPKHDDAYLWRYE